MNEYKLSVTEAVIWFEKSYMTAKGLLHLYFATGGDKAQTAPEISKQLGISENTCRKAIATLRKEEAQDD